MSGGAESEAIERILGETNTYSKFRMSVTVHLVLKGNQLI